MENVDKLIDAEDRFNYLAKHIMDLEDIQNRKSGSKMVEYHIDNTRTAFERAYDDPTEKNILAAKSMSALFTAYAQSMGISGMRLVNKDAQRSRANKNEKLSRVDGLTQLSNKMGTLVATEEMIARSRRDESSVAVFFIDLTKFKPINDTLGHQQGDKALQLVAEKIQETVRDGDIVGRVGGDEFVIVMANQDPEHDFSSEKQHLTELFDGNIVYQDAVHGDYPIGGDIGLAIVAEGEIAEATIARADHLMYEAKQIRHRELEEAPAPTLPEPE